MRPLKPRINCFKYQNNLTVFSILLHLRCCHWYGILYSTALTVLPLRRYSVFYCTYSAAFVIVLCHVMLFSSRDCLSITLCYHTLRLYFIQSPIHSCRSLHILSIVSTCQGRSLRIRLYFIVTNRNLVANY